MNFSLADVDRDTAAVRAFDGADLASLPRAELLSLQRLAAAGRAAWDVVNAGIAGEIARRSRAEDGPNGLARQQGFASPEQFVASVLGTNHAEGAKLVAAGTALGQKRPVGDGLREGTLSVGKADLIAQAIRGLSGNTAELEARLVRMGKVLDYARLKQACRREAALFDAVQLEGRERRQADARCFDMTEDANGMTHIRGALDPVSAGILRTYLDAQSKAAFQARRDEPGDVRTATQVRADALVALAAHGLDCESRASGVKATIVVRVNKEDLEREVGFATCDAVGTPISLAALRQLAVDASVLPMVMGSDSLGLDLGREERLFSWYQRMVLAERDGGCAKCHAPVSHCITHHIRWWSKDGRTDLSNGVLLCWRCHTEVHHDRWGIEVDAQNRVWFIPPPHVDRERTPRLGGLAALTM